MEQKKTETSTFRLEKDILEKLRDEAKTEKISLNAYVNQIITKFVEWYAPAQKAGMVPLPKQLLIMIMEKLSDEQIIQIAENMVTKEIKDIILALKGEHDAQGFVSVIESWAKTSNFPVQHQVLGESSHKYVITHEMGKNWSLYFGVIFTRMFEELGLKNVNCEITDKTLIFSFTYF